jgi:ArsR family transcriptional regulator, lead/cadmium/zinc/bismuth-responsive transcriptional repressor
MGNGSCAITEMDRDKGLCAMPRLLSDENAARLAETFRALSDPTRVRILSLLLEGELCVCDLAAALDMSQSAISHQLRTLRDWRLVRRRRAGRLAFYTLDDEHVADLFQRALEHVRHE